MTTTKNGGWTHGDKPGLAARRAGLQPYLTNIANSGADVLINVNWGRDAVLSIQQAKQFGVIAEDEAGDSLPDPVPGAGGRGRSSRGRLCGHRLLVDAARTSIRWPRCSSRPSRRSTATSRSGAPRTPICRSRSGRGWSRGRQFYPPDVIKAYEKGEKFQSTVGEVLLPQGRPSARPPGRHRQGQGRPRT